MNRVQLGKSQSKIYQSLANTDKEIDQAMLKANFSVGFIHLLRLLVSLRNGCAYCLRLHSQDALKENESIERVAVISIWQETDYFTSTERAAFALAEAITLLQDGHVSDEVYAHAQQHLTEEQIAAVSWLAIIMNSWNRVAITSRYYVGEKQANI